MAENTHGVPGTLKEPKLVPDPDCKTCHGEGRYVAGYSGREDDGNAPLWEDCDCFIPAGVAPTAEPDRCPSCGIGYGYHLAGCAANNLDSIALEAAQEIALMWGRDRTQFVAKIQVAVRTAMERAAGVGIPLEDQKNG